MLVSWMDLVLSGQERTIFSYKKGCCKVGGNNLFSRMKSRQKIMGLNYSKEDIGEAF